MTRARRAVLLAAVAGAVLAGGGALVWATASRDAEISARSAERDAGIHGVSAAAQACASRDGGPSVRARPDHGPPGTRVTIVGECFEERQWNHGYGIFLIRQFSQPRECEVIGWGNPFRFRVDSRGRGRGFFTVPSSGDCFQQDYGRRVTPGVYAIGLGCHACGVGTFRVTR